LKLSKRQRDKQDQQVQLAIAQVTAYHDIEHSLLGAKVEAQLEEALLNKAIAEN
jgi:hypothetical protein